MALPKVLKNFNFFVDGVGFTGRAEEITLPKVTHKMEEYQGAGMLAPVEIDLGLEKLEMDFTLKEFSPEIIKQMGTGLSGVACRWVGAAVSDDDHSTDAIEIHARGRFREQDLGTSKMGEAAALKAAMALTYFKYVLNGETLIEVDSVNMVYVVDGVDLLEQQRSALSM